MKAMKGLFLCLVLAVLALLMLPGESPAPINGQGWIPSYSSQLGFRPDVEPDAGEIVSSVVGAVTQSAKLTSLGLASESGDRIKLIAIEGGWKVNNLSNGKSITLKIVGEKLVPSS